MKGLRCYLACATLIFLQSAHAGTIPNTDNPTTFLGPYINLGITNPMSATSAYSILGELGLKNYRLNGTLGWQLTNNQRLKISAEYLQQDITYSFFAGNTDQWMKQGALGANYRYDFLDYLWNPQFSVGAYGSYAPSKTLHQQTITYLDAMQFPQEVVESKRIAGSSAWGVNPGISITPWQGAKIGADLNYDTVNYDTKFVPHDRTGGFGGTLHADQAVTDYIGLNFVAAVREPYNNYQANINWRNISFYGLWQIGIHSSYIIGKNTLPNTFNIGLTANYFIDELNESPMSRPDGIDSFMRAKEVLDVKGVSSLSQQADVQDFLSWTAQPAVYMPQVLAIADSKVDCLDGEAPTVLGVPMHPDFNTTELIGINISTYFTGENLTFTATSVTPNPAAYPGDFINLSPNAGNLTYDATNAAAADQRYTVTITASNRCGSAQSSILLGPEPF